MAVVMAEEIQDEATAAVAEATVVVTEPCTKVAIAVEIQVVAAIAVDTVVETMVAETQVVAAIAVDTVVETMVAETQDVAAIERLSKIIKHQLRNRIILLKRNLAILNQKIVTIVESQEAKPTSQPILKRRGF